MTITPQQARQVQAAAELLYSEAQIEQVLDRMADEISDKLADANPIVLCVLNGALIPLGHLLTRLNFPLRQDYVHATRYQNGIRGADLEWVGRPETPLQDETVLVFDDILDEGITLAEIVDSCIKQGAKAVFSAVLVRKLHERSNGFVADFVGIEVEDRYVFGYGMDYKGYLRNAPGIFAVCAEHEK